jgi:tRNA threonylcarbamoyladenosine biosynthesis protein TsaB
MTKLTLVLQTSNGVPVMGLAIGNDVVFDSAQDPALLGSRDYRMVLETGLGRLNASLRDINDIFVDIGPGGLGVTRTGVAFANALGFALGLPTTGLPAFELLGAEATNAEDAPVVILRKAARPFVHFGIFENGVLAQYEHCERGIALKKVQKLDKYILIGNVEIEGTDPPITNTASMATMLKRARSKGAAAPATRAYPIVEVL